MPKTDQRLQDFRSYPEDPQTSYDACIDSVTPYNGGYYEDADAVTEDVIFGMIATAAKTHQALRFDIDLEYGSEAFNGVWNRVKNVLKIIAPDLDLNVFMVGSHFMIVLYDRLTEQITPSVMDEARDGDFQGRFGHLLQPALRRH